MKWPIRLFLVVSVAVALVAGGACASSASSVGTITDVLGSSLGVSGSQASAGVGSVLSYAQNKLSASDYTKVANSVPGADQYVQKAKDAGAVPAGGITDKSGLDAAYAKLGISPEVAKKFTPAVLDYVGKAGGSSVQSLLGAVLQ
jgi:hypothetical protein